MTRTYAAVPAVMAALRADIGEIPLGAEYGSGFHVERADRHGRFRDQSAAWVFGRFGQRGRPQRRGASGAKAGCLRRWSEASAKSPPSAASALRPAGRTIEWFLLGLTGDISTYNTIYCWIMLLANFAIADTTPRDLSQGNVKTSAARSGNPGSHDGV